MALNNRTQFWIMYCDDEPEGTSRALTPLCCAHTHHHLHDILSPPAEHIVEDIGEKFDFDTKTWSSNPKILLTMSIGNRKFQHTLPTTNIWWQPYHEVIWNNAGGFFANYEKNVVPNEDVAWLRKHDHIVNPPAADSLTNRMHTSGCLVAK